MELPEAAAGVIEYAVERHADIFLVRCIEQFAERLVTAQKRINVIVIVGVIAMIGCGCKDRREINGVRSKVFDVVEMFCYTAQIAALESINSRRRIPRLEI